MADSIKYQVFVSSTYKDLVEERRQILDVLLMADCIPAGMESFVAQDDEQFNIIKKVIDLCDYYILILGRRYGSVSNKTGISYTEMEYNYAIEKGIPVLVFALSDDAPNNNAEKEEDDIKRGKLAEFKSQAMTNRLASVWKDQSDLIGKVAISIMKAKSEIARPGWHRGADKEKQDLLDEINKLKEEKAQLIDKGIISKIDEVEEKLQGKFYGSLITLHFTEKLVIITSHTTIDRQIIEVSLDALFKHISVRLTGRNSVKQFIDAISSYKKGYSVEVQDALIVKNKYEQLGIIQSYIDSSKEEVIELTKLGREIMNKLNML